MRCSRFLPLIGFLCLAAGLLLWNFVKTDFFGGLLTGIGFGVLILWLSRRKRACCSSEDVL